MDYFSKFIFLHPETLILTRDFVGALLKWIGGFGVQIRLQILAQEFQKVLGYDYLAVTRYHPQANSLAEHRMKGIMFHMRFGHSASQSAIRGNCCFGYGYGFAFVVGESRISEIPSLIKLVWVAQEYL